MRCGPDCRYGSAYPPRLSVKADLLAWQPSAISGCEQVQQSSPLIQSPRRRGRGASATVRLSLMPREIGIDKASGPKSHGQKASEAGLISGLTK
jgi:hypothetical protein